MLLFLYLYRYHYYSTATDAAAAAALTAALAAATNYGSFLLYYGCCYGSCMVSHRGHNCIFSALLSWDSALVK